MSKQENKSRPQKETRRVTREEWLASVLGDIDPLKHAGDGWFSTEEYPTPGDVSDPFLQGEIGKEGDYYPGLMATKSEAEALRKLLTRMR